MCEADADVKLVKSDDYEIDLGDLAKLADAAPVIKLVDALLVDSLNRRASDLHVEPHDVDVRVRFRIDGVLYDVMALPMEVRDPLTQRIKSMADLNLVQTQLPQDGRFKVTVKIDDLSRSFEVRASVRPTPRGETIVLRLLHTSAWQEKGQQLIGKRHEALVRAAEREGQLAWSRSPCADTQELIDELLAEGRVYRRYGLFDKARAQFETVLERFPGNSEALEELHDLQQDKGEALVLRAVTEAVRLEGDTDESVNARVSLAELLLNEHMVSLEQCLGALMDQKLNGGDLRAAVVRLGFAKDEEITSLLLRTSTGSL